jgi:hypothetical protein
MVSAQADIGWSADFMSDGCEVRENKANGLKPYNEERRTRPSAT